MAQIDTSLYNAFAPRVKSVQDYDNEYAQGQMNQLNLLRGRQEADQYTRKVGAENAFSTFKQGLAGKSRAEQIQMATDAGFTDFANAQEDAYTKQRVGEANIRQSDASALNSTSSASKAALEMRIKAHDFSAQEATAVRDAKGAVEWAKRSFANGAFGDPNDPNVVAAVQQKIAQLGQIQTPQQLEEWRTGAVTAGTDIKTQLENQYKQMTAAETKRNNLEQNSIQRGQLGVAQQRLGLERQNAAGAVTYQTAADGSLMALPTKPGAGPVTQRAVVDEQGNQVKGRLPGKGSAMSATAQKELFEADDMINASKSALTMLKEAKTYNSKAYSGVGATLRAKVMSNTLGSDSADATVQLDNIIGGQALESLKSIFGGAPTEGERKILLELQASSDKTPTQRADIIARSEKAVQRRLEFNSNKAKSLREGSYFNGQGGSAPAAPPTNPRQLPGGFELVD